MAAKKSRPEAKRAPVRKIAKPRTKTLRARSPEQVSELDLEAIAALERFAQYARVALTTLPGNDPRATAAHLERVRSAYESIYEHPVALMTIVREAKWIIEAVTLHHHAQAREADLDGAPSWITPKVFARLVTSTAAGRGGRGGERAAKRNIVAGVVRLVHARCPHAGAKRLKADHLMQA